MICHKCKKELSDEYAFCPFCGSSTKPKPRKKYPAHRRANGMGTALKRGTTWTAVSPAYYVIEDGQRKLRYNTKGGFRTKTEALLAAPTLTARRPKKDYSEITFQELYAKFIERHAGRVSKGTADCYRAAYKYYTDLYNARFTDLITEDWQGCIDDCPQGLRTLQNMKMLGTKLYAYAAEQDISHKDFAQYIYLPPRGQFSRNAFPRECVARILSHAQAGTPYADYIACLIFTGFRPTALFNLKKTDYDPKHHTLTGGIKTPAGRDRVIPVSDHIRPFVEQLLTANSSPWLFPNPSGGQFTDDNFRKDYFYDALARMGIQPIPTEDNPPTYTPYSARHTFFTMMARASGDEKVKAELGGHTDYNMSEHYVDPDLEDKRAVISQLFAESSST